MQTLRIFIGSPGDVADERAIATRTIAEIENAFGGRARLEPILWEHEPLLASAGFQEQIPRPSQADIAVFILWGRLGSQLPKHITREDGSRYASGTEFEFEDARASFSAQGKPLILTYRKVAQVGVSLEDEEAVLEKLAQKKALDQFERKWFHSMEETSLIGAFHPFNSTEEFKPLFEVHLRKLVGQLLPREEEEAREVAPDQLRRELRDDTARGEAARSLAVLPFQDLSPGKDQEHFCDGMAEELTGVLTAVEGLEVAPTAWSREQKGSQADPQAVAEALGVRFVLTGSVRKAGERLRVTVTLVDARKRSQIWSERFDREEGDVFAVQDEIARQVAEALQGRFTAAAGESARPATGDAEAYDLYLKARYLAGQRTGSALAESVNWYKRALDRDRDYARAWAGLAESLTLLGVYGYRMPGEVLSPAEKAVSKALALDPELADAHRSRGSIQSVFRWSWLEGEASFRRALELKPDDWAGHQLFAVMNLMPRGRFQTALEELRAAWDLSPETGVIGAGIGAVRLLSHDFEAAERELRSSIELTPGFSMNHFFLGRSLTHLSRYDEAIAELERALELSGGSPEVRSALAFAQARAGRTEEARKGLAELERHAQRTYLSPALLAQVHWGLGDAVRTLELLEQALALRAADLIWMRVHPAFSPLHEEARFREILSRVGLAR